MGKALQDLGKKYKDGKAAQESSVDAPTGKRWSPFRVDNLRLTL